MTLNADKVGTPYPAYVYEVSREKIREYAAALGETDPRYFSDGPDCVAPPTFAACFTVIKGWQAMFDDPELGTHTSLVHGSQRFEFGSRPLRPGDRIVCTPRIASITSRGGNELLVAEVDGRFVESQDLAVRSEATIVFLPPPPAAADTLAADPTAPAPDGSDFADDRSEGVA